MSVSKIASRYAKSLFDIAIERNELERVHTDVEQFNSAATNGDFRLMLKSPIIKPDKKAEIMEAIFGQTLSSTTNAFLKILIAKGREPQLVEIAAAFLEMYKSHKGISTVLVVTAVPLTDTARQEILARLKQEGAVNQEVELHETIDPSLLGGFVLKFNDKLYDASVAHQLDLLSKTFQANHYLKLI